MTGDLLGTLRYMSPEQALAKRVVIDHRTDIYSLGATLYELATLHPVFEGDDRQELLRQIAFAEPRPLRKVNPAVPRELETVVLKALAKDPSGRYGSAQELADDLKRFLEYKPIKARRPSLLERAAKWARRHPAVVWSALLLLVLTLGGLSVGIVLIGREKAATERVAEDLRRQDYVNKVRIAYHEVLDDNPELADDQLFRCPADLRGWEWHYVNRLSRLDLLTYEGHKTWVLDLAVSPDGRWVVSASGIAFDEAKDTHRAEVKVWDVDTGQDRLTLPEAHLVGTVHCVAISPDGKWIATGGGYYIPKLTARLILWNAATGEPVWVAPPETGSVVRSVAFSPDGKSLAAGYGHYYGREGTKGQIRFWDVASGKEMDEKQLPGPVGGVFKLAFHPDGRRLAAAGYGCTDVWDLGPPPSDPKRRTLGGHTKWVYGVAFSPDRRRMATGSWDGTIKIRDAATLEELMPLRGNRGYVYGLAFSPDSRTLAAAYENHSVKLWDVETGGELAAFRGHTGFVWAVAFHPDGRRIVACDRGSRVKVWDVEGGQPVVFRQHTGWVSGVAFSEDGRRIASESESRLIERGGGMERAGDETIRIWDPRTGRELAPPIRITPGVRRPFGRGERSHDRIATSRDGRRRAVVGNTREVKVIDTATGRIVAVLKGGIPAFSPDGSRVATAIGDFTVKLWETETGREVLSLRGHTAGVTCLAFSPDGSRIATGSIDNTVRIWDATPVPDDELVRQEARWLIKALEGQYPLKVELIEQLRSNAKLSEPVRAAALEIAECREDSPMRVSSFAMDILSFPGRPREEYLRALRWIDSITWKGRAEGWDLNHRGVALYRLGRYREARRMLERSWALNVTKTDGATPLDIAFLAMTHHQLGHRDAAGAYLEQLRESMKPERWSSNTWCRMALEEAEALIEPENRPRTRPRPREL
jgi:WD40 repeat protein